MFSYDFMQNALFISICIAILCPCIGIFIVLKRYSMIGDTLAHSSLAGITRIVVGEFEEGFCGISVWMPPTSGSVERQFLAELDPDDGTWYCTNKADIERLPGWCR